MSENAIDIIRNKKIDFEGTLEHLAELDLLNPDLQRELKNQINCLKWVLETLETK